MIYVWTPSRNENKPKILKDLGARLLMNAPCKCKLDRPLFNQYKQEDEQAKEILNVNEKKKGRRDHSSVGFLWNGFLIASISIPPSPNT